MESLRITPLFLQHLRDARGFAIADLLEQAANTQDIKLVQTLASAAYERTWDKLHSGSWKDVQPVWRQSFGIASILCARCMLHRQQLTECLKTLDLCLIMAGPFAPPETHALIVNVESQLQATISEVHNVERPHLEIEGCGNKIQEQTELCTVRRIQRPTLEDFRRNAMLQNEPVIITGGMEFWPALGRVAGPARAWKDVAYLRRVAGFRTVPVEVGSSYLGDDWDQKLMTLNGFLDEYIIPSIEQDKAFASASEAKTSLFNERVGYLAQHCLFDQIPALGRDIMVPDFCTLQRTDDDNDNEDITVNCWFGPRDTVSPLHYDPKDNLLCQVVGSKYIRLYAPEESDKLYPVAGLLANTSSVHVETPDDVCFPKFRSARYVECVLREGEMLYIPPKYWHYVKSLSTSFSVSFWWS